MKPKGDQAAFQDRNGTENSGNREKEELSMETRIRNTAESREAWVAAVGSATEHSGAHTSLRTGSQPGWACPYTLLWAWHHWTAPITSQDEQKVEYT